jgi:hypothetical protein
VLLPARRTTLYAAPHHVGTRSAVISMAVISSPQARIAGNALPVGLVLAGGRRLLDRAPQRTGRRSRMPTEERVDQRLPRLPWRASLVAIPTVQISTMATTRWSGRLDARPAEHGGEHGLDRGRWTPLRRSLSSEAPGLANRWIHISDGPWRARLDGGAVANSRGAGRCAVAVWQVTFVAGPDGVVLRPDLLFWSNGCVGLIICAAGAAGCAPAACAERGQYEEEAVA